MTLDGLEAMGSGGCGHDQSTPHGRCKLLRLDGHHRAEYRAAALVGSAETFEAALE